MYPAVIEDYVAPTTIDGALKALAEHGEGAHFIAGGQSLMQAVKARLIRPTCLVDLQHVAELRGIAVDGTGVRIGAMTRYREVAADGRLDGAYQALRDAASHVGDRQVRNRGTLGGSLCWNFIAACMPPTVIGQSRFLTKNRSTSPRRFSSARRWPRNVSPSYGLSCLA